MRYILSMTRSSTSVALYRFDDFSVFATRRHEKSTQLFYVITKHENSYDTSEASKNNKSNTKVQTIYILQLGRLALRNSSVLYRDKTTRYACVAITRCQEHIPIFLAILTWTRIMKQISCYQAILTWTGIMKQISCYHKAQHLIDALRSFASPPRFDGGD